MLKYEFTQVFLSVAQVIQLYGVLFLVVVAAVIVAFASSFVLWSLFADRRRQRQVEKAEEVVFAVLELKAELYERMQTIEKLQKERRELVMLVGEARRHGHLWNIRARRMLEQLHL
jgi:uncharacterized membrane protein (DUF106 family)